MFRKKRVRLDDAESSDWAWVNEFIEDLRNISTKAMQAPLSQSDYWILAGEMSDEHDYIDDLNEGFNKMHRHTRANMPISTKSINKKKIEQEAVDKLMNIIDNTHSGLIKEQRAKDV